MKIKHLLICFLIAGSISSVSAQEQKVKTPPPAQSGNSPVKPAPGTQNQGKADAAKKAEKDAKKLATRFQLTPAQESRARMIYNQYHLKAQSDPVNKDKYRTIRDSQIRKELGPELSAKYNDYLTSPEGRDEDVKSTKVKVKDEHEGHNHDHERERQHYIQTAAPESPQEAAPAKEQAPVK